MEGSTPPTPDAGEIARLKVCWSNARRSGRERCNIVRNDGRIGGVRVPLSTDSTFYILFAGQSSFTMRYQYEVINDVAVHTQPTISQARR